MTHVGTEPRLTGWKSTALATEPRLLRVITCDFVSFCSTGYFHQLPWFGRVSVPPSVPHSLTHSHSLTTHSHSLHFNGHFPGEPGLAGVYWSTRWWRWWWQLDHWSYKSCKAPVKSSPPTNQHPVCWCYPDCWCETFYPPDILENAEPTTLALMLELQQAKITANATHC